MSGAIPELVVLDAIRTQAVAMRWWYTSLIPALRRQRPTWSTEKVPGQPGYTEKPCLKNKTNKQNKTKQKNRLSKAWDKPVRNASPWPVYQLLP